MLPCATKAHSITKHVKFHMDTNTIPPIIKCYETLFQIVLSISLSLSNVLDLISNKFFFSFDPSNAFSFDKLHLWSN